MRRLAIFWLACAAVGFLAAVGVACVLSLAVDGASSWQAPPAKHQSSQQDAPTNAAAAGAPAIIAPALNRADR